LQAQKRKFGVKIGRRTGLAMPEILPVGRFGALSPANLVESACGQERRQCDWPRQWQEQAVGRQAPLPWQLPAILAPLAAKVISLDAKSHGQMALLDRNPAGPAARAAAHCGEVAHQGGRRLGTGIIGRFGMSLVEAAPDSADAGANRAPMTAPLAERFTISS
jgi:hypothetical protein